PSTVQRRGRGAISRADRYRQWLCTFAQPRDLGRRRNAKDSRIRRPAAPRLSGDHNAWVLPIPATFVIARDGTITARFIDPDFRKRVAIKDLLKALQDAQSQEEAGRKA